ncbi:hypothetical protein FS749_013298 [Ceratobasidium sp. UAMH 11750]|nr:hypothetical protein FS749_013298 [Ceratobasidium sp. UAMH 11750]
MFASRMLLRVPGRAQTLYFNPQLRAFSITRIALDPAKKASPLPPPPPPPAPASKRVTKAAPVEPEMPIRKPRLVLSDKQRDLVAKEKANEKVRAAAAKEKERLRAAKKKLRDKEKAAAAKQREKERQLAKKEKEKERQLAKKEKEKERELAKKEKERKKAEKPYPPPPKRPSTSYFLFAREYKPEPGAGVTQAAIEASEAWKALSDSEKQGYAKKFEEARAQYKTDLANWVASLNFAQLAAARDNREPGTRDEAAMEHLPKRPATSYALFLKDTVTRPDMISKVDAAAQKEAKGDPEKLKKLRIGIGGRLAAAEWKAMSDKDRQAYTDKAADLKAAWDKNFGALIAQQKEAQLSATA